MKWSPRDFQCSHLTTGMNKVYFTASPTAGVGLTRSTLLYSQLRKQVNNIRRIVSPCGVDLAAYMALSWMENPAAGKFTVAAARPSKILMNPTEFWYYAWQKRYLSIRFISLSWHYKSYFTLFKACWRVQVDAKKYQRNACQVVVKPLIECILLKINQTVVLA